MSISITDPFTLDEAEENHFFRLRLSDHSGMSSSTLSLESVAVVQTAPGTRSMQERKN